MLSPSVLLIKKALFLQLWERKQDIMVKVKITPLLAVIKGGTGYGQSAVEWSQAPNRRNAAGIFIIGICICSWTLARAVLTCWSTTFVPAAMFNCVNPIQPLQKASVSSLLPLIFSLPVTPLGKAVLSSFSMQHCYLRKKSCHAWEFSIPFVSGGNKAQGATL